MNRKVSNLQVGENTLLSFVTAASLGAEYIEFGKFLGMDPQHFNFSLISTLTN